MTEQETLWIEQARQGDDGAFGYLVESYQRPVFSVCYRILGNSRDAEDTAQENSIRAYRYLNKYDPNRPFGTCLLSTASHYYIDRMRKRRLNTVSTDVLPAEIRIAMPQTPKELFRKRKKIWRSNTCSKNSNQPIERQSSCATGMNIQKRKSQRH